MFKRSIRNKLIILLLLITIIPFGTSIAITFFYTKETLKEQTIQESVNLLFQGKVNIETYLKELNNLILVNYNNSDFMLYLKTPGSANDYTLTRSVNHVLNSLLFGDDSIHRVSMSIVQNHQFVTTSKQSSIVYTDLADDLNTEHYNNAEESPYNLFIEASPATGKFILHRAFRNVPAAEVLAYFSVEVRPDKINDLSNHLYHRGSEEFYILTPEGDFIYHSNGLPVNDAEKAWVDALVHSEVDQGKMEWSDDTFQGMLIFDTISNAAGGWILVKRVPYAILYESAYGMATINIFLGVVGLCLVIFASLLVSVKITTPIRELVKNIRQVEKGDLRVRFESLGNDEIGILGHRFKMMVERINQLINREYKLELENKTNQLKVLQSQINPHFLYNTLQSIGTMALKSNAPQVYTSLTELSQIMRYGMNTDEDVVPLVKEVNYTKAYMQLQKQRFGEELVYILDVDEDTLNVPVPKMLLQPVIENYFKHGFDIRENVGEIIVTAKKDAAFLHIKIKDNGVGIVEERLQQLRQHLYSEESGHSDEIQMGIGLKNVYTRLKLYYSGRAALTLQSRKQGGFCVAMKLPLEMEDGIDESADR
ncbi:two-component system, sensor histidine kinase YesM [Evansella caseinilytica]|uniref:histidine kinase n=1 Tax=Evansella caseinilytica TaxID=1503961 RepID=A0A1H3HB41_9BACI|nr:histidine kinase [Evansella caseinilytica]SDY12692.1 two-component system, sensor histidine kinase YesM [Evansella caseinilytica]